MITLAIIILAVIIIVAGCRDEFYGVAEVLIAAAAFVLCACLLGFMVGLTLVGTGVASSTTEIPATVAAQAGQSMTFIANDTLHTSDMSSVSLRAGCEGYGADLIEVPSWLAGWEITYIDGFYKCEG